MAANTDETIRKPRRTRGTPSYYYRNRFASGVLITGVAIFAGLYALIYNPSTEAKIRRLFENTVEQKERRALIAFLPRKRGEEILRLMEENENLKREN